MAKTPRLELTPMTTIFRTDVARRVSGLVLGLAVFAAALLPLAHAASRIML